MCNLATGKTEDQKFEASGGYKMRPYFLPLPKESPFPRGCSGAQIKRRHLYLVKKPDQGPQTAHLPLEALPAQGETISDSLGEGT